tara:strand:- start:529 stop:1395 length:867 start_codon:yes stop_codon:yes gene_type:complete
MSLLIAEQPLQILPKLAANIGLNEAILVQQIHYWLQRSKHNHDGQKWIYNTHESWLEQFPFWSKATLKRVITSLKSQGIINTGNFNRMKMDRTVWYTINYSHAVCSGISEYQQEPTKDTERQADQPLGQSEPMLGSDCADVDASLTSSHKLNMTSPIPETTETTTEITTDIKEAINFGFLTSDEFKELTEIRIANYKAAKKKASVMTQRIANTLINQISLAIDQGFTVDDVLSKFATRGWLSFECEWMAAKDAKNGSKTNTISINGGFTPQQEKRQRLTNTILNPPEW